MAVKKKTPPDGGVKVSPPRDLTPDTPQPAKPKHKPLHPAAAHNLVKRARARKR